MFAVVKGLFVGFDFAFNFNFCFSFLDALRFNFGFLGFFAFFHLRLRQL